jgi:hypothetical protein
MGNGSKDRLQEAADAVRQRGMETTVDLAEQPENDTPSGEERNKAPQRPDKDISADPDVSHEGNRQPDRPD